MTTDGIITSDDRGELNAFYDGELGPGSVIGGMADAQGVIVGEDVSGQRPNESPDEIPAVVYILSIGREWFARGYFERDFTNK